MQAGGNKIADVVKIDKDLLNDVKKLVSSKENRIKYSNAKQFVNIAVLEKLAREKENGRAD